MTDVLLLWVALGCLACALFITLTIRHAQYQRDPGTEAAGRAIRALALAFAFVFALGWCYWLAVR